jgi:3-dehydroquinate dehydratase-2
MKIIIINGPNLNLLGNANQKFSSQTFEEYFISLQIKYMDLELIYFKAI